MRLILFAGTTETARIDGISAAGADPDVMVHTPSADAEILTYGRTVRSPVVPVSPTGCPSPAVVTRAARDLAAFEVTVVDAGLAAPTAAPTVDVDADPGRDLREAVAVPGAAATFESAREVGRAVPDDEVVVGETIPGGTTTALGVARALGEPIRVSSSLPENPTRLKSDVVTAGLEASGLDPGDAAGDPVRAVRAMGDPVLASVSGFVVGALETGTRVVLGGGTQFLAAAALVRHAGETRPLTLATTSFIADDLPGLSKTTDAVGVDLVVTDPGFEGRSERVLSRFVAGEAKEGAGMGGGLHLADRAGRLADVPSRTLVVYDDVDGDDGL